jgi:hypothetical protein
MDVQGQNFLYMIPIFDIFLALFGRLNQSYQYLLFLFLAFEKEPEIELALVEIRNLLPLFIEQLDGPLLPVGTRLELRYALNEGL